MNNRHYGEHRADAVKVVWRWLRKLWLDAQESYRQNKMSQGFEYAKYHLEHGTQGVEYLLAFADESCTPFNEGIKLACSDHMQRRATQQLLAQRG